MSILIKSIVVTCLSLFIIQGSGDAYSYNSFNSSIKDKLTPMQYYVTQENGTEPAFNNAYWNNHAEGIYVDIVSGEPLFSSSDKFDSGTGWPSFTQPIDKKFIVYIQHYYFFINTTEVRSKYGNSHLGDVFHDGPPPTGIRYCIDSAALKFIPLQDMEKMGYGAYIPYVIKKDTQKKPVENKNN